MTYREQATELAKNNKLVFGATGETGKGFQGMHHGAITDGALDAKTKELMSLGIAICLRCEGCIVSHVESLVKLGATMEEITETVNVALLMGGGPSVVYGGKALACAEEFFHEA